MFDRQEEIRKEFSGHPPVNVGNILDFAYNFSVGTADNGNVTGITNNRDTTRSQSFAYDPLNRISTAKTTSTSGTKCWDEQFGYDPWGNLLTIGRISGYTCSNEELLNTSATTKNQISGNTYDSAGNLISIPSIATYTYNAENQLTATAGVTYMYDGDGKRVQKSNGKLYWYGMGSDPLDETDLTGSTTNAAFKEYIFFGGKRIARRDSTNAVNYYFADHLGTARVTTNAGGTLCYDADFYPFGGERIVADTCDSAYKFTGKERDSESGLDNFGARYNSSNLGRFISVDPSRMSVKLDDPQTLNRYAYARDNPLEYVDRNGKWSTPVHNDIIDDVFRSLLLDMDRNILKQASAYVDTDQSVAGSYKHGMHGLDQSVGAARHMGEAFITGQLDEAVKYQLEWEKSGHTGQSPGALFQFGEALHTVTDSSSPWHDHYEAAWAGYWDPLDSLLHAGEELAFGPSQEEALAEARYEAGLLWQRYQQLLAAQWKKEEEEREKKCQEEGNCG